MQWSIRRAFFAMRKLEADGLGFGHVGIVLVLSPTNRVVRIRGPDEQCYCRTYSSTLLSTILADLKILLQLWFHALLRPSLSLLFEAPELAVVAARDRCTLLLVAEALHGNAASK